MTKQYLPTAVIQMTYLFAFELFFATQSQTFKLKYVFTITGVFDIIGLFESNILLKNRVNDQGNILFLILSTLTLMIFFSFLGKYYINSKIT